MPSIEVNLGLMNLRLTLTLVLMIVSVIWYSHSTPFNPIQLLSLTPWNPICLLKIKPSYSPPNVSIDMENPLFLDHFPNGKKTRWIGRSLSYTWSIPTYTWNYMGYIIWIICHLLRTTSSYGSSDTDLASLRRFSFGAVGEGATATRFAKRSACAERLVICSSGMSQWNPETCKKKTWKIFAPILHLVKNVNHQICFYDVFIFNHIWNDDPNWLLFLSP